MGCGGSKETAISPKQRQGMAPTQILKDVLQRREIKQVVKYVYKFQDGEYKVMEAAHVETMVHVFKQDMFDPCKVEDQVTTENGDATPPGSPGKPKPVLIVKKMAKINAANENFAIENKDGSTSQLFDIDCILIHLQKQKIANGDPKAVKKVWIPSLSLILDLGANKGTDPKGETFKLICPKGESNRYARRRSGLSQRAFGEHQFALTLQSQKTDAAEKDIVEQLHEYGKLWAGEVMEDQEYVPSAHDIVMGLHEFMCLEVDNSEAVDK